MTLIDNAEVILRKAWSVKMGVLTTPFVVLDVVLPLWERSIPPRTFASLAIVTSVGGQIARFLKQNGIE